CQRLLAVIVRTVYVLQPEPICLVLALDEFHEHDDLELVPEIVEGSHPEPHRFGVTAFSHRRGLHLHQKLEPSRFLALEEIDLEVRAVVICQMLPRPVSWETTAEESVGQLLKLMRIGT